MPALRTADELDGRQSAHPEVRRNAMVIATSFVRDPVTGQIIFDILGDPLLEGEGVVAGDLSTYTVTPLGSTTPETLAFWMSPAGFQMQFLAWFATLPTALPQQSGLPWNNGGALCVS